jgi:anthranilate phosphoribosyltransferase
MKTIAPIRRELSVKTFFNILGPMVNPSFPQNQVVGVWNLETARLYNYIYQQTNKNYTIVYSLDGYDEISLTSEFKMISNNEEELLSPETINYQRLTPEELKGGANVKDSVKIFLNIIEGKGTSAQKSIVIVNSGMALRKLFPGKSLRDCFELAEDSLQGGKALNILKNLLEL